MAKAKGRVKGDERILGDSEFVLSVLAQSNEKMERGYQLAAKGIDVATVARYVAEMYDLEPEQLFAVGRFENWV